MAESRRFFTEDYGFCQLWEAKERGLKFQDLLLKGIKWRSGTWLGSRERERRRPEHYIWAK